MTKYRADDEMPMDAGRLVIVEHARQAKASGAVTSAQVLQLTRRLLDGRAINRDEADALFELDAVAGTKCAEWTECLVDAITEHVVWQSRPTGVVNSEQAEWLLAKFDASKSISALATLVNILAEADRVPVWFLAAVRGRVARHWPSVDAAMAQAAITQAA